MVSSLPAARKIAVLGDMLELGAFSEEAHRAVGTYAAQSHVDILFCFGKASVWIADAAKDSVRTKLFITVKK